MPTYLKENYETENTFEKINKQSNQIYKSGEYLIMAGNNWDSNAKEVVGLQISVYNMNSTKNAFKIIRR